ncbi:LysR substrate-binding domain-containing protein [Mesorhizobium sp. LNJC391B00]|uniref:LysR substrate-binding domain-containing protein n=1 Tax=Mesorhizobium sp. LNJC391B00 TaxID=1287273 RepID=UPI0024739A13|nr:LysR substrate-binding domain-containing protein [Mesorhizobium sp. LNJC391B00]
MTASVDIAQTLLPPVIAAFRKAYPAVAFDLVVTDRVADLVADGIDLAVRVGPLRDSSLISRAFVTGPSGLLASQAYLDRRGTSHWSNSNITISSPSARHGRDRCRCWRATGRSVLT